MIIERLLLYGAETWKHIKSKGNGHTKKSRASPSRSRDEIELKVVERHLAEIVRTISASFPVSILLTDSSFKRSIRSVDHLNDSIKMIHSILNDTSLIYGVTSVSYTHLDVYKRQRLCDQKLTVFK